MKENNKKVTYKNQTHSIQKLIAIIPKNPFISHFPDYLSKSTHAKIHSGAPHSP